MSEIQTDSGLSNGVPKVISEAAKPPEPKVAKPMGEVKQSERAITEEAAAKVQLGQRLVKPEVAEKLRQAFREAAAEDPGAPVKEPVEEAPVKAPAPEKEPAPVQAKAEAPADFPPHVIDAAVRIADAQKAFEKQKEELKPRLARIDKLDGLKGKFKGSRLETAKELLALIHDGDPAEALSDLMDDYTRQVLQIEPTSESKALSVAAEVKGELHQLKQEKAEAERKRLEEVERTESARLHRENVAAVEKALTRDDAQYPYLKRYGQAGFENEPSMAELVYGDIVAEFQRSGNSITVEQAAERREELFRSRINPFRDLLSPSLAPETAKQPDKPKSQGPRTLSSSVTTAPAVRSDPPAKPTTREERRKATLAKIGKLIRDNPQ